MTEIMMKTIFLLLGIGFLAHKSDALSCFCGASPCETPQCCSSGQYSYDSCACCKICAKGLGESCGGPWNVNGMCAEGLSCYKTCECKGVDGESECIFPFKYKGKTYNECTTFNSENGKAWCATKVNGNGVVVNNKWVDCQEGCPGMNYLCGEPDLFNFEGKCVSNEERKKIESNTGGLPYEFIDGVSAENKTAKVCPGPGPKNPKCGCTSRIPEGQEGNCMKPNRGGDGPFANGWCFLQHIDDPESPASDCFKDVQWSKSNGQFWSVDACQPK